MINYGYTNFHMDNHGITFDGIMDGGVLISIPFADDTPKAIKDILNAMIRWNIDEWLRDDNANNGYILEPGHLMLNARMQIIYDSSGTPPSYCIAMVITDFTEVKNQQEVWIDDTYNIRVDTPELRMEFKTYCQQKLNEVLFPIDKN